MKEPPRPTALQSLMTDLSDKPLSIDQRAVLQGLKIEADRANMFPPIEDQDEPEPPEAINDQPIIDDEDGA